MSEEQLFQQQKILKSVKSSNFCLHFVSYRNYIQKNNSILTGLLNLLPVLLFLAHNDDRYGQRNSNRLLNPSEMRDHMNVTFCL